MNYPYAAELPGCAVLQKFVECLFCLQDGMTMKVNFGLDRIVAPAQVAQKFRRVAIFQPGEFIATAKAGVVVGYLHEASNDRDRGDKGKGSVAGVAPSPPNSQAWSLPGWVQLDEGRAIASPDPREAEARCGDRHDKRSEAA